MTDLEKTALEKNSQFSLDSKAIVENLIPYIEQSLSNREII